MSGQLNGRALQSELHPFLFNTESVAEYIAKLRAGEKPPPPSILIELYLSDVEQLSNLKGTNNTSKEDVPGVSLAIEFNNEYGDEFARYVADPDILRTVPIEYYKVIWRGFSDNDITARSIALKPGFIDASAIRNSFTANKYVVDIMKEALDEPQRVDLALAYRMMKDTFMSEDRVKGINDALAAKKGQISDKTLTVSLDTSSRASWETGIMPHLDDVPLTLVGKGEQNTIKIKLALETSADSHVILVEEAENHLSHSNLNALIGHIRDNRGNRQLLLTTHSSFVLNKLGVESVILFHKDNAITLKSLKPGTHDYFMRLPGHDTLRLILARRAILVEGPSDELIVQIAYKKVHDKMPLEDGVDVISVNSLAFKRFLEIAALLNRNVSVVTDNDKDIAALGEKYKDFEGNANIKIHYDTDIAYPTLEPQLLKANSLEKINKILDRTFATDADLLDYMKKNKTDTALRFFQTDEDWNVPEYIQHAVA